MMRNKEQQLLERQIKMSKQEESYTEILIGFILGALVCGMVITLVLNKLKFEESLARLKELEKPSKEATELVGSIQWKVLEASLGDELAEDRISLDMYTKAINFLSEFRDSNSFYGKPPSDYGVTESGAVVFNWNKVIYHRIDNEVE